MFTQNTLLAAEETIMYTPDGPYTGHSSGDGSTALSVSAAGLVFTRSLDVNDPSNTWVSTGQLCSAYTPTNTTCLRNMWDSAAINYDGTVIAFVEQGQNTELGKYYLTVWRKVTGTYTREQIITLPNWTSSGTSSTTGTLPIPSVIISGDGNVIAVLFPSGDYSGYTSAGFARLYRYSGSTWSASSVTYVVNGPYSNAAYGNTGGKLSYDGSILAVGAIGAKNGSNVMTGNVNVHTWVGSGYVNVNARSIIPADLIAEDELGYCGLSDDGTKLVAVTYSQTLTGTTVGAAYVYTRSGYEWTQLQKFQGVSGSRIAAAAISPDGQYMVTYTGNVNGTTRIYKWNGSQYSLDNMSITVSTGYPYNPVYVDNIGTFEVGHFANGSISTTRWRRLMV